MEMSYTDCNSISGIRFAPQVILLLLVIVSVAICLPSDADPTDPDVGSNYSPTDLSGTVLKKKKLKKLLFLG
ncbi:hypothetical protein L798_12526 [Zootermopsis nevadensis]|uniref:Uncharacterized protein n=1 Tax=Zootermopsis nevadensis TaxID=136037 RepID=A0A067R454_ZOONE|nr:hypothetical protein L798_12526 [Zootermopsis nevadensis]